MHNLMNPGTGRWTAPLSGARAVALVAAALAATAILAAGCSPKYTSERDGKALGDAVCDLREADDSEARQQARDDIDAELENLGNEYAFYTSENRDDVQAILDRLEQSADEGDIAAVQEELASLDSSARDFASNAGEVTQAAWDGLRQGLSNCIG